MSCLLGSTGYVHDL